MASTRPYLAAESTDCGYGGQAAKRPGRGTSPCIPYPVWSWQRRRKWLAATWALYASPEPRGAARPRAKAKPNQVRVRATAAAARATA